MGGVDIWLGAIGLVISLGVGITIGVHGMNAMGLVISLGVGVLLGMGMMFIFLRGEPSGGITPAKPSVASPAVEKTQTKSESRNVKTQSQTRYAWTRSEPRFVPLAINEQGAWSDSD